MYDNKQEVYFAKILLFKLLGYAPLFLNPVVNGECTKVKELLGININFLTLKGSVTDCSGRGFSNISGFEYALWAKDKYMWNLMLDCVKQLPLEERITVVNQLIEQYKKIKNEGISYTLNGQAFTEHHFDFENTIIKELKTQVDAQNASGTKDWNAIDAQWKTGVGGAQKLLPMHVVYEYCSETPFSPTPDFINVPLTTCRQFYKGNGYQDWFVGDSKLGINFAIVKGAGFCCGRGCRGLQVCGGCDLTALETLCKVRTADFNNLEEQLEALLQVDLKPTVAQLG